MTNSESHIMLAVLLNPPARTAGVRTRNAVRLAGELLGFGSTEIVNLTSAPTPTVLELNELPRDGWLDARVALAAGLRRAEAVLGGWGTTGLTGAAREARSIQIDWFVGQARKTGIEEMWTVGGRARHPSRWHQYMSDKYGRTSGGSFPDRLRQVLVRTPFEQDRFSR